MVFLKCNWILRIILNHFCTSISCLRNASLHYIYIHTGPQFSREYNNILIEFAYTVGQSIKKHFKTISTQFVAEFSLYHSDNSDWSIKYFIFSAVERKCFTISPKKRRSNRSKQEEVFSDPENSHPKPKLSLKYCPEGKWQGYCLKKSAIFYFLGDLI